MRFKKNTDWEERERKSGGRVDRPPKTRHCMPFKKDDGSGNESEVRSEANRKHCSDRSWPQTMSLHSHVCVCVCGWTRCTRHRLNDSSRTRRIEEEFQQCGSTEITNDWLTQITSIYLKSNMGGSTRKQEANLCCVCGRIQASNPMGG